VHSQHLIKNRILRQLSADELKSVQPWLTLVQLKSNVVLHEPGGAVRWSVPPFTTEVECKMASLGADLDRLLKSDRAANRYDAPCAGWVSAAGLAPTSGKIVTQIQIGSLRADSAVATQSVSNALLGGSVQSSWYPWKRKGSIIFLRPLKARGLPLSAAGAAGPKVSPLGPLAGPPSATAPLSFCLLRSSPAM
jgi:hypothetical protein